MKFSITTKGITCPCCLFTYKNTAKVSKFIDQITALENNAVAYGSDESIFFAEAQQFSKDDKCNIPVKWACNECLGRGKAISTIAIDCQNRRTGTPVFAYFDEEKLCRLCDESFIFRGTEQKHWLEDLNFFHLATRVYCDSCQAEITLNKKLSYYMSIINAEESSLSEYGKALLKASKIYAALGKNAKAKGILKIGLNRLKCKDGVGELVGEIELAYKALLQKM